MKRIILLSMLYTSIHCGSPAAISQQWSKLNNELSTLEKEDVPGWIAGRAPLLEQINGLVQQGFGKQAIPLFQRIHKRDSQILQEQLPLDKSKAEWDQLKRDKKSLKTIAERQALTIKNLEAENKKKYDAQELAEKNLQSALAKTESLTAEIKQLKTENEKLSKDLQEAHIALASKNIPV